MKRVAISIWNGRVSPVFDVSRQILLLDLEGGEIRGKTVQPLVPEPEDKVHALVLMKIGLVICGAISRSLAGILAMNGILVVPYVSGEVEEVVRAYISGTLMDPAFLMPGCHYGRHRSSSRFGVGDELMEGTMGETKKGDLMQGGSRKRGRMGRSIGTGSGGWCKCPSCDHREEHVRGLPCNQNICPECGSRLIRE